MAPLFISAVLFLAMEPKRVIDGNYVLPEIVKKYMENKQKSNLVKKYIDFGSSYEI